jgi:Na+-driven multidrug efflux pump
MPNVNYLTTNPCFLSIFFYIFTTGINKSKKYSTMKTFSTKLFKQISLVVLSVMLPFISFAETSQELAAQAAEDAKNSLYTEIISGVAFGVAVIVLLIWKFRYDKKVRIKQEEQMKKVQASRRRAA